jgi:aminoglycoside 6'-N-acetyltransferase
VNISHIQFRPLEFADLPLMHEWLNRGEVLRWYGIKSTSLEEVTAHYSPLIRDEDPTRAFAMLYDGLPIGYIQTYLLADYPVETASFEVELGGAGVDLFIGDEEYLHRGLGSKALRKFLQEIVFTMDDIDFCIIDPVPDNNAAICCYEKAGFVYQRTVPPEGVHGARYLMRLERKKLAEGAFGSGNN